MELYRRALVLHLGGEATGGSAREQPPMIQQDQKQQQSKAAAIYCGISSVFQKQRNLKDAATQLAFALVRIPSCCISSRFTMFLI